MNGDVRDGGTTVASGGEAKEQLTLPTMVGVPEGGVSMPTQMAPVLALFLRHEVALAGGTMARLCEHLAARLQAGQLEVTLFPSVEIQAGDCAILKVMLAPPKPAAPIPTTIKPDPESEGQKETDGEEPAEHVSRTEKRAKQEAAIRAYLADGKQAMAQTIALHTGVPTGTVNGRLRLMPDIYSPSPRVWALRTTPKADSKEPS